MCLGQLGRLLPMGVFADEWIYDPGFDEKIPPVYMRGRIVTTGTDNACVFHVWGILDNRY